MFLPDYLKKNLKHNDENVIYLVYIYLFYFLTYQTSHTKNHILAANMPILKSQDEYYDIYIKKL